MNKYTIYGGNRHEITNTLYMGQTNMQAFWLWYEIELQLSVLPYMQLYAILEHTESLFCA